MSNVLVEKNKLDILATAISNKSGEPLKLTLDEMVEAVDGIEQGIQPSGNIDITHAGQTDVTEYATATVAEGEMYVNQTNQYLTVSGVRKWRTHPYAIIGDGDGSAGYIADNTVFGRDIDFLAVASNTTITPTESAQTIGDRNYMMEGAVTVNAIPSNYVGSGITRRSSSDLTNSLPSGVYRFIVPAGYYAEQATKDIAKYDLPTPTISIDNSTGVITATSFLGNAGYINIGTKTATEQLTLRDSDDLTVSGATVTAPSGYYSTSASKSVASGSAGTPTATKGTVSNHAVSVTPSVTNTTGYITGGTKSGTAVTVSASELVSGSETKTENGTYDVTNLAEIVIDVQGGGSSTISVGKTTRTLASASSSIQFTGLSGNPTSFAVTSSADITTNTNGVTAVVFDGTSLHGQILSTQATADTGFTKSYSGGTLTITATTGTFQANEYKLVYTYGGSTSDIETADIQVGSGATSITFPVTGRPIYWSCIFKSDFSTSSGYQRAIEVVNDGTSTYGMALDSTANALTSWTANYSGGNLTITSQSTNNGGYFHQPGYYQLTYAVDLSAPQYQTKTVSPSTSQQTVTADSGYDALEEVIVNAMPSMTLPSSTSATSSGTSKATISASSSTQYLNIPTGYNATAQYYTISASGGGSSKNVQVLQSTSRTNASSLTKVLGDLTVSKTGTYDIYWSGGRSNTSASYTWGTRLYIDGTGYGTENTSWSNNCQSNHLSNVSLTANQKLSVYARGRTGSYYTFAPMLAIVEA